jgi:hypothetical protein
MVNEAKPTDKRIASFYSLDVEILSEPNDEIRKHLSEMVLGTPGKLQYRFLEVNKKLSWLKDCKFLILKKYGRVIGSVCLIRRESPVLIKNYPFWYIRYFFIRAPLKPKSYKLKEKKRDTTDQLNFIWKSVAKYFEQPEILVNNSDLSYQSLLYSYVQKSNVRAINLNNAIGIIPVKKLKTYFYSRIRPVKNPCVRQIVEEEKRHIIDLLREFYRDYVMYSEQNLFFNGNYYVYVKDNEIVAGMQANPEAWEFLNKPGLIGFILIKVLPRIPIISKYWKPKNFRFSAIEGLFCRDGHEDKLFDLMESVCSIHKTYFIFYWVDPTSSIYKVLSKSGSQGFLSRFLPSEEIDICTKFINWKEEEINDFIRKPAYISCFDST